MVKEIVKELVSKSEFARRSNVSAAAVTKACSGLLKNAMVGKKIDVNHPDSVKYRAKKFNSSRGYIIDPIYEDAVNFCINTNRWSAIALKKEFKIGMKRAKEIMEMITLNNIQRKSETQDIKTIPHNRGQVVKNENKKQSSLNKLGGIEVLTHEIPDNMEQFADMTLRELIIRFGTDVAFNDWLKAIKTIEDINEKRLKNAQSKGELVNRDLMKVSVIEPINSAHIKLLTDGAKTIARRVVAMTNAGRPLEDCEYFVADQITSFIRPIKAKISRALKDV
jgi:hypothetical protein